MRVLLTYEEYAKQVSLSHAGVRKQVSAKYQQSITIDKVPYVLQDDKIIKSLKQNVQKKNGQIRELKLKLELKTMVNDERYIQELERQIKQKDEKLEKLESQKDGLYEKFLATVFNQKKEIN
jgi:DNA repair exonuclease SbcCD ATPase subunit